MPDDEEELNLAILAEFEWGRQFLDAGGHPGAVLTASQPNRLGIQIYELGGRFRAKPDRLSHAVLEVDPGRIGWRIEAYLSIWHDDQGSSDTVDLGRSRTGELSYAIDAARDLTRQVIVCLRDHLEAGNDG